MRYVTGSNAPGNPQLDTYLAASRDHNIAPSDLTLVEMRKEHAITNSRMSLRIASQFPSQGERLGMRREGLFLEFVTFETDRDGVPIFENTLQYAILRKE